MQLSDKKSELFEKGYTTFNLNDFKEFQKYYDLFNEFKEPQFIKKIKGAHGFKFTAENYPKSHNIEKDDFKSFTDAFDDIYPVYLETINKNLNIHQYWFRCRPNMFTNKTFENIMVDVAEIMYEVNSKNIQLYSTLTYYGLGCKLEKHTDGIANNRFFGILLYLNENYDKMWGGNLILKDECEVVPEYGNVAIIDFSKLNASHEVTKVVGGPGRMAYFGFVAPKEVF